MAYITGWRVASEVLPLEWRQVDFNAGEIRLDAGTTKNREGRLFPFTAELRDVLAAQHAEHERLKKAGQIAPWIFWRMVAKGRGGEKSPTPITSFNKASDCVETRKTRFSGNAASLGACGNRLVANLNANNLCWQKTS